MIPRLNPFFYQIPIFIHIRGLFEAFNVLYPTPTPTFFYPVNATPLVSSIEQTQSKPVEFISPNNKWKISFKNDDFPISVASLYPFTVSSLTDQKTYYENGANTNSKYFVVVSWFPDNSGFIIMDADNEECEKGCPYDRLIVYQIDPKSDKLQHYVFEPLKERNRSFWSDISWSPDGLRFAVTVDSKEIDILDRKAHPLQQITPDLKNDSEQVVGVQWTTYGLLYMNTDRNQLAQNHAYARILYQMDPAHPNIPPTTLFISEDSPDLVSYDPFSERILVHRVTDVSSNGYKVEATIFNVQTRQFEKSILNSVTHIYYTRIQF